MAGHSNNSIWDSWFIGSILVILGLLNLGIQIVRIGKGNSRETFNFPRKGKGKNSTTGKQTRKGAGTVEKPKCTLCGGSHRTLISCPKLPQYIPYGKNQVQPPASLCHKCLGTGMKNANQCKHGNNSNWKKTLCPKSNKSFILCSECSKHIPALEYMRWHHNHAIGFKNFTIMRQMFGADVYRAMCSTVSESDFNSLPTVPVSMFLRGSTVHKVGKGVQVVLAKSGNKEAIWKEAEEGNQIERLTLDKRCIITLGVICVILIGLMWYSVEFKDYQLPGWFTDENKA